MAQVGVGGDVGEHAQHAQQQVHMWPDNNGRGTQRSTWRLQGMEEHTKVWLQMGVSVTVLRVPAPFYKLTCYG